MPEQHWHGYQLIICEWTFWAISGIFVAIRVYVQAAFNKGWWGEFWVIVGWLLYLITVICESLKNDWDLYNPNIIYNFPDAVTADKYMDASQKARYVEATVYKLSIYACKAALLCFYHELMPKALYPRIHKAIIACWIWVAIGALSQIIYHLVSCWPFHLNWSYAHGACGNTQGYFRLTWGLHIFTDLIVYILPFFILAQLKNLTRQQKIGAAVMFGLGFINVFIATAVIVFLIQYWYEPWASGAINFLECFQQATAIIIICLPQLRRFIKGTSAENIRRGSRSWSFSLPIGRQLSIRSIRSGSVASPVTPLSPTDSSKGVQVSVSVDPAEFESGGDLEKGRPEPAHLK